MTVIKTALRALLTWSGAEFSCYKMFRSELAAVTSAPRFPDGYRAVRIMQVDVEKATDPAVGGLATFDGRDTLGFAVLRGDEIVSLVWVWYGARYREERNFWPLASREAKIVQTFTVPSERGKNLSTLLMQHCALELRARGFERLYSRIWWNHHASIRVAQKSGRVHIATVIELRLSGGRRRLRYVRRMPHSHRASGP